MRPAWIATVATPRRAVAVNQPRGEAADMRNKWVIAVVLVAAAVFMYVSIIYSMS